MKLFIHSRIFLGGFHEYSYIHSSSVLNVLVKRCNMYFCVSLLPHKIQSWHYYCFTFRTVVVILVLGNYNSSCDI